MDKYTANRITEKIFTQVDDEANKYLLMNKITDNRKYNTAIPISDGMMRGHNEN